MSSPASYKPSKHENDFNVPEESSKATENVEIGKPHKRSYLEFNTHTPPDITPNTRILAICGIASGEAAPNDDGWILSDFFAFYHLCRGLTEHQTWMHGLDLETLVAAHGPYLHGNPSLSRKVVLDKAILEQATRAQDLHPGESSGLRSAFKEQLKSHCQKAAREGQGLLVLIFAHGDGKNGGFWFPSISSTVKEDEIEKIVAGFGISVTVMSTACYSGGWVCNKSFDMSVNHDKESRSEFNKSTLMAAGPENPPIPGNFTTTARRACGSMFSTAIIDALTKSKNKRPLMELDDDDEIGHSEEQQSAYEDFSKTVYETFLRGVDRRGHEHHITFSPQEDAWEMCWGERTGFPLSVYETRWNSLEDHDADRHPGDPWNRDPSSTAAQEAEYEDFRANDKGREPCGGQSASGSKPETNTVPEKKGKTSGMFGRSIQALVNQVSTLGGQYLESHKGFDQTAADGSLHNFIYRIQLGSETSKEILEDCLRTLEYRMDQMSTADEYLRAMSIPPPFDLKCHEFQTYQLPDRIDKPAGEGRYRSILDLIFEREVLFPDSLSEQGHQFYKGPQYLVAAFYEAGLPKKEMVEKLDTLVASVVQEIEYKKDILKNDPEIRSKRQRLLRAFGIP